MILRGHHAHREEHIGARLSELDTEAAETTDGGRREEIARYVWWLIERRQVAVRELGSHLAACVESYPRASADAYPL